MLLNDGTFGYKYFNKINGKKIGIPYKEDEDIIKHYFTNSGKIYSDRLPKFVVKANQKTNGEVIKRISRIYPLILVDEVQDLAGYDLDILKLLFKSKSEVLLVGDPRQVTYLTHHENKYAKYKNGKIKCFIEEECKRPIECNVDTTTLNCSHRNNNQICEFSHKLYAPEGYDKISPCECSGCRTYDVDDEGIYLVKSKDVDAYLQKYNPIQLRWSVSRKVNLNYSVYNFGESKGKTFERVIIYPTDKMEKWVYRNSTSLPFSTKAKFYVGITRARFSVAIVTNFADDIFIEGINLFKSDSQ
jgi:DNA helicase-2/ATP-dependent DNA helicase PcrA